MPLIHRAYSKSKKLSVRHPQSESINSHLSSINYSEGHIKERFGIDK